MRKFQKSNDANGNDTKNAEISKISELDQTMNQDDY